MIFKKVPNAILTPFTFTFMSASDILAEETELGLPPQNHRAV